MTRHAHVGDFARSAFAWQDFIIFRNAEKWRMMWNLIRMFNLKPDAHDAAEVPEGLEDFSEKWLNIVWQRVWLPSLKNTAEYIFIAANLNTIVRK